MDRYIAFARLVYAQPLDGDTKARTAFVDALHKIGIPTFPTSLADKVPLAGTHGLNSADTDRRRIAQATTVVSSQIAIKRGECNWAIPTGSRSGLVALDIDDISVVAKLIEACPESDQVLMMRLLASGVLVQSPTQGHLHIWLPEPDVSIGRLRLQPEYATCEVKAERNQLTAPFSVRRGTLYQPVPRNASLVARALGLAPSAIKQEWLDRGVVTSAGTTRLFKLLEPFATQTASLDPAEMTAVIELASSLSEEEIITALERALRWWTNTLRDGHDRVAYQLARRAMVAIRVGAISSEDGKQRVIELFPAQATYRWSNNKPGQWSLDLAQKLHYQAGAVASLDEPALTKEWAFAARSFVMRSRSRASHGHAVARATVGDDETNHAPVHRHQGIACK